MQKTIEANIPILGNTKIHFYNDSTTYWEFVSAKEIDRLNKINHLGPASLAHTGANHTRLEYTYLQCAIIELVGKIHKDSSALELSNGVELEGLGKSSSGEDVLKTWALISSYGHLKWTYATERVLLQLCYEDTSIKKWMLKNIRDSELRKWCNEVIDSYDDHLFHYVMAIRRIYYENPYDRNKTKLIKYLRNLLVPSEALFPDDLNCRFKLHRLRQLFERIRVLSIASIDSYNSGSPIRFQLSSSLTDSKHFIYSLWDKENNINVLKNLIGDLASKLYYHTSSTPIQRAYVAENKPILKKKIYKVLKKKDESIQLFNSLLNNGLGKPSRNTFEHLLRLSFKKGVGNSYFGFENKYDLQKHIEEKVGKDGNVFVSVENNYYKNEVILDIHNNVNTPLKDIGETLIRLKKWIFRNLLAQFKSQTRMFSQMSEHIPEERIKEFKRREFSQIIRSETQLFDQIFFGIIKLLLPDSWSMEIRDYIPTNDAQSPVYYKIELDDELKFNNINTRLDKHITKNPYKLNSDRLQELKAVDRLVKYTRSEVTLSCSEKIIITNNHGKSIDEWDGVLIKIDDKHVRVIIVEAKNFRGSGEKNENQAWKQLNDTINIVTKKFNPTYQRKRIKKLGARLILDI